MPKREWAVAYVASVSSQEASLGLDSFKVILRTFRGFLGGRKAFCSTRDRIPVLPLSVIRQVEKTPKG